jgi:HEAT repeat protein
MAVTRGRTTAFVASLACLGVLRTLGRIGPDARAAIPALEKALSDEDDEVRREAAKALGRIRGAAAPSATAPAAAEGRP